MLKKSFQIYIPIITILFIISVVSVFAAEYHALIPSAFGTDVGNATNNLSSFLKQLFNWGIAVAVMLALIMIIWGGIQYMTTDSWNKKDEGKTRIQEALKGLGLALVSWLILYTINPALVSFSGNTLLSGSTGSGPSQTTGSQQQTVSGSNSGTQRTACTPPKTCTGSTVIAPTAAPVVRTSRGGSVPIAPAAR